MKTIAIFVDGSNHGRALNTAGFRMDYKKLREYFAGFGELVGSYYFTALPPKTEASSITRLTDNLSREGWMIVSKEIKRIKDDDGISRPKGNMDIEMVVRAWKLSAVITDLILFSGDGDFRAMAEQLSECGVRTTVCSLYLRNRGNVVADELRRNVHEYIDLTDLRKHVERFEGKDFHTRRSDFLNE